MPSNSLQRKCRSFTVLASLFLILSGCGGEKKQSGSQPDAKQVDAAKVKAEIKELLPAAAGMPYREFELLATRGATPSLERLDNQRLSLVLLALRSDQVDESLERLKAEFDYISPGPPKPSDIAEAMIVSRSKGYASVIQPDYIDQLTCDVKDGNASGQVTFTIKDCFKATVQFVAEKRDDKWQITEFSLPAHQARTVLGKDGKWTASGVGVTTPSVSVKLPLVAGLPPREDSPNRLVFYVGRGYGPDRDEYLVGIGEKKASLGKAEVILAPELGEFCKQKSIATKDVICVIRADGQIATGNVQQVIKRAMEEGVEQYRLQARLETDDESGDPFSPMGEAAFRFPLAAEEAEFKEELYFNDVKPIETIPSFEDVGPPVEFDEPHFEPVTPPKLDGCSPDELLVPPMRVRLRSAPDRTLVEIGLNQLRLLKNLDGLQQHLKELVGDVRAEAAIEFDVDYELRYDDFMKVVAACSGYKQKDGKWVPLIEKLILAPPRHPEG